MLLSVHKVCITNGQHAEHAVERCSYAMLCHINNSNDDADEGNRHRVLHTCPVT